jgi:hypothetical protein
MDHLAQATTDHNTQHVIKSTRRADSTHSNLTATAKLPPLNGHLVGPRLAVVEPGGDSPSLQGVIVVYHPRVLVAVGRSCLWIAWRGAVVLSPTRYPLIQAS